MSEIKPRGRPFAKGHGDLLSPEGRARVTALLKAKKGVPRSARDRAKISAGLIGRKMSEKNREAIRLANLGRKQSDETKARRAASRAGYVHSQETKEKIGRANSREAHKTDESKRARMSAEYREWRNAVYARDDWTCQKCLVKGGRLHPHHIRNFAEDAGLRFSVDNGITLCVPHHKEFHSTYGQRNNTAAQIAEFIR